EAAARLRVTHPAVRLVIAGDGSLRSQLEAQIRRQLPSGAGLLLGHRADVAALHHAFDVFVQSSDYEGTSNAVLEAMALETPVIATAAGGTAEMIEHGVHGLVVGCGDPIELATAISQTLLDPIAKASRVARARRRVERD